MTVEQRAFIAEGDPRGMGNSGIDRMVPQLNKEIALTSTNDWQYFYLSAYTLGGVAKAKTDSQLRGGPLALIQVETNAIIIDWDGIIAEGSASLSSKSYPVGKVADSLPVFVIRIAYKSAVAGAHGVLRFMAPYDPVALGAM